MELKAKYTIMTTLIYESVFNIGNDGKREKEGRKVFFSFAVFSQFSDCILLMYPSTSVYGRTDKYI